MNEIKVGSIVTFLCNGKGRGGHYRVKGEVTKINRKTFHITELTGSYNPGVLWTVDKVKVSLYK